MGQPGSGPRPDQPDRAEGHERAQGHRMQRAPDQTGQAEPVPQTSPQHDPDRAASSPEPGHPVVAGYDGSQSSRNALAYAAGMARRLGRPLLVVYVVPFGVYCEPMTGQVICTSREKNEMERWLLSELAEVCDAEGLEVSVIARRGNAAKELAAAADVSSADALVVGAPGHRLHHVVGSIPSWLARHAKCPVIVVP